MPSGPNKMQRHRRIDVTDEAVIDEFSCIYSRTYLQEVSGFIRIKLKKLVSGQIVVFWANVFRSPSKILSRTPVFVKISHLYGTSY